MTLLRWDLNDDLIIPTLSSAGIEPDQRLHQAIGLASRFQLGSFDSQSDLDVVLSLGQLNAKGLESIPISGLLEFVKNEIGLRQTRVRRGPTKVRASPALQDIFEHAIAAVSGRTLSSSAFISGVLRHSLAWGDSPDQRGFFAAALARMENPDWAWTGREPLSLARQGKRLLEGALKNLQFEDDFQFGLTLSGSRLRFAVVSQLGDYIQETDAGVLTPTRALLTHFGNLGLFSTDSIGYLESLVNDPAAKEDQFQEFFEQNQYFFRKWDYREVYPHVYLTREEAGPLIPDFILTNRKAQEAAVVELKRPQARIVRHQDNRVRFSSAVMEARAQLLEYQRWFEQPEFRLRLAHSVGMEIYRPRLMVIIGRSQDFADGYERQMLRASEPNLEVVTYDDLIRYADERRFCLEV